MCLRGYDSRPLQPEAGGGEAGVPAGQGLDLDDGLNPCGVAACAYRFDGQSCLHRKYGRHSWPPGSGPSWGAASSAMSAAATATPECAAGQPKGREMTRPRGQEIEPEGR